MASSNILAASIPIIAAFVTSVAALLGLVITKENKTSEFRQCWINELRHEIADLQANALMARHIFNLYGPDTSKQDAWQTAILKADTSLALIRLRLNMKEVSAQNLLVVLNDIQIFSERENYPQDQVQELENRLHAATRDILKPEWDRVRRGEPIYRITRLIAFILAATLISALLFITAISIWQAVRT